MGAIEKRQFQRFDFDGTAMLVFDDRDSRRTLAITNYRNVSQGGACILTPAADGIVIGDHLFLMPERYRRKREAIVVELGTGRLHLELARSQFMSEFEIAELLQCFDSQLQR